MFGRVFKDLNSGRHTYRVRVPRSLVSEIGRTELKRTLKTRDRSVAERRALTLAGHAFDLIDGVRRGMLNRPEIQARLKAFYEAELDSDLREREAFSSAPGWTLDASLPFDRAREAEQWKRIARAGALHIVEEELAETIEGLPFELTDAQRRQLAAHILHLRLEAKRVGAMRDDGNLAFQSDDPFIQSLFAPSPPSAPKNVGGTIPIPTAVGKAGYETNEPTAIGAAKAVEMDHPISLIVDQAKTIALNRDITDPKTQEKYRIAAEAFADFLGERSLESVSRRDVAAFYDALRKLRPSARTVYGAETSFTDCVKWSIRDRDEKPSLKAISEVTIRSSYFSPLRMIFDDMINRELTDANPFSEFKSPRKSANKKKKGQRRRDAFVLQDVETVLRSPLYEGSASEDRLYRPGSYLDQGWRYWFTPLLAMTGLRSSEAGQLGIDGQRPVWCIRVWTDEDSDDPDAIDEPKKRIKTDAGYRYIPIHPQLERMGFLELARKRRKAGETRLFPDWVAKDGAAYSDTASRFFNKTYYRKIGIKRKKTSVHSWRHFFNDMLRDAGIERRDRSSMMGHAAEETPDIYGSERISFSALDRFLKIDFGFANIRRWSGNDETCASDTAGTPNLPSIEVARTSEVGASRVNQATNDQGAEEAERYKRMRRRPSRLNQPSKIRRSAV